MPLRQGGNFDDEADEALDPDAFLSALAQPQRQEADEADRWFAEMEARYGGKRNEMPLDAEALLTAYEARYGKEAAEWERRYLGKMNGVDALGRLDILWRAMQSADVGDVFRRALMRH